MIIDLELEPADDSKFLTAISSLIAVLVAENQPEHLYVARINKWFDHKWLNYSGTGRVKFDEDPRRDTAHEPMWQGQLTFPPFNPKQIGAQFHWSRKQDGSYSGDEKQPRWIHKRRLGPSSANLQNRVADFTDSGLFVWFTSNTATNTHGSIMVYGVDKGNTFAWYASFKQDTHWVVEKVKGEDKANVERWFPI